MSEHSPMVLSRLLTTQQAAELLCIRPETLERWRYSQSVELPYIKIGKCVRYSLSDLEKFLASKTQGVGD